MNEVQQALETFCKYAPHEKIDFLVQFAHALTILARDTYAVGEEGLTNPLRLRIINEIQHRVTGCLMALRKNDSKRYPDDVLVRILLDHPEDLSSTAPIARNVSSPHGTDGNDHRTTHCSGRGASGAVGSAAKLAVGGGPAPAAQRARSAARRRKASRRCP